MGKIMLYLDVPFNLMFSPTFCCSQTRLSITQVMLGVLVVGALCSQAALPVTHVRLQRSENS